MSHVVVNAVSVALVQQDGSTTTLEVPDGENILSVALDSGLDVPHDCTVSCRSATFIAVPPTLRVPTRFSRITTFCDILICRLEYA
jgi:hypothetical protein